MHDLPPIRSVRQCRWLLPFWLVALGAGLGLGGGGQAEACAADAPESAAAEAPVVSPQEPASIQRAIDWAIQTRQAELTIPPGEYRLPPPAGKVPHLRIGHARDLVISAVGVTLVFPDPRCPSIRFDGCRRVTLRGPTLVREAMIHSQGRIEEIGADRQTLTVRVAAGYPAELEDPAQFGHIPVLNVFEPDRREWKVGAPELYTSGFTRLEPGRFSFRLRAPLSAGANVAVGDRVAWRGLGGHGHDIFMGWCAQMALVDLTIRNAAGMCFMELAGDGGNRYENCVVTYGVKPAGAVEEPLLATSVDGLHSSAMRRGPQMENCRFEGLDDDAVNIHGVNALACAVADKTVTVNTRVAHIGPPISAFCVPGDRLAFLDENFNLADEAMVLTVKARPDYRPGELPGVKGKFFTTDPDYEKNYGVKVSTYLELGFERPIKTVPGGFLFNRDAVGDGFTIRNCQFRDKRAHGLILGGGHGLVEGNIIENCVSGGILVVPSCDGEKWSESGYACNLVIRNNLFRRAVLSPSAWEAALHVAVFEHWRHGRLPGAHRRVSIEDNIFADNNGPNLVLNAVQGVEVTGNRFYSPMQQAVDPIGGLEIDREALVWLTECSRVTLRGNRVEFPGPGLREPLFMQNVEGDDLAEGIKIVK